MAAFQTAYNSSLTGPDDQIIKLYGRTSSHSQPKKTKLLEYFLEVLTNKKFVSMAGVHLGNAEFVV